MKFLTPLSKLGRVAKSVATFLVGKALPAATMLAEEAKPFVDIAAPQIGAEFNVVTDSVFRAEQAAAVLPGGMTGPQKLAAVVSEVKGDLLPVLVKQGLSTDQAMAAISKYADSVVTIWNTFPAPAAPAQLPAVQAQPKTATATIDPSQPLVHS